YFALSDDAETPAGFLLDVGIAFIFFNRGKQVLFFILLSDDGFVEANDFGAALVIVAQWYGDVCQDEQGDKHEYAGHDQGEAVVGTAMTAKRSRATSTSTPKPTRSRRLWERPEPATAGLVLRVALRSAAREATGTVVRDFLGLCCFSLAIGSLS